MSSDAEKLLSEVLGCKAGDLPTLPDVAHQVIQLGADPRRSASDLARVLARDPALTARMLKVANSPSYGCMSRIDSLQRAVVVLGFEEVRKLALSITAFQAAGSNRPMRQRFQRSQLWNHSQFVGLAAETLARHDLKVGRGYYVHGLIHDIGKVALDAYRPKDFDRVLDSLEKDHASWCDAEAEVFGVDHSTVGRALLVNWNFPPPLIAAAGGHHRPWECQEDPQTAGLVFLADYVARLAGSVSFGAEEKPSPVKRLDGKAALFLHRQGWRLDELLVERITEQVRDAQANFSAVEF